ncbi:MAG: hypothetical protein QM680_08035 [Luteolibacter sp.]
MADAPNPTPQKSKGGCFSRLVGWFLCLILAGFGALIYFVYQPQKLDDLGGYRATAKEIADERDVSGILKLAVERGFPVTLTEGQINRWLSQRLQTRQGGLAEAAVKLKHVWVRLEDGRMEIITERELAGRPFTLSMYLGVSEIETAKGRSKEVRLHGGPYSTEMPEVLRGGRFGKVVVPQGFLILVLPEYKKLAEVFTEELNFGAHEMSRIEIKKGKLVLTPGQSEEPKITLPGSGL